MISDKQTRQEWNVNGIGNMIRIIGFISNLQGLQDIRSPCTLATPLLRICGMMAPITASTKNKREKDKIRKDIHNVASFYPIDDPNNVTIYQSSIYLFSFFFGAPNLCFNIILTYDIFCQCLTYSRDHKCLNAYMPSSHLVFFEP